MRRFARIVLLAVIATLVLSAPVFAYLYRAPLTIAESGGYDYGIIGVSVDVNNQWLIDNGFITTATALDTRVQSLGGSNYPHLVVDDRTLTACSVSADSQTNLYFVTDETPLTAMDIITGYNGYVTINDNVALEPASNFKFEYDGYINTNTDDAMPAVESSATSSINVVNTNHAVTMPSGIVAGNLLIVYVSTYSSVGVAQANISNWGAGWTSLGVADSNTNPDYCIGVAYKVAAGGDTMTFTTAGNSFSSHQSYRVSNFKGTPEISSAAAWSGATTTPDPPSLTTSWGNINATLWFAMCGGATVATRTMSSYPSDYSNGVLKTNTGAIVTHCGVARRELIAYSQDPGVFTLSDTLLKTSAYTVSIKGQDIGLIAKRGAVWIYADNGGISATESGGTTLTAAAISSGEHKVEAYSDGANWKLELDDVLKDTDAIGGGIPGTIYNWILMSNATPYANYYSHTVGGIEVARYEPVTMIIGTALIDEVGTYDGVITWGANPAGVDVTLGSMESSGQAGTGDTTIEPPRDVMPTTGVSDWYGDGTISKASTLANPFRAFITMISDNTTLTEIQVWRWMGIAILLFVTVGAAKVLRGHQGITAIIAGAVLGGLVAFDPDIFPFWLLVISIGCFAGGIIAERSPSL